MIFRIESTTSMVLVPGWRWMARITDRSSLYQLATLSVCTLSTTRPSCSRRRGEPLRKGTRGGREAGGGAVAIGDDERPVGRGTGELAGGLDAEGLVGPVQRARRHVDVRLG